MLSLAHVSLGKNIIYYIQTDCTDCASKHSYALQLGQLSVIPPGLVLEAGGDFNLAGSYACKVEVPPTSSFQVGGDFSSPGMAAC